MELTLPKDHPRRKLLAPLPTTLTTLIEKQFEEEVLTPSNDMPFHQTNISTELNNNRRTTKRMLTLFNLLS